LSDIDFQNGFVCGMATKGLVRSGQPYKPEIWNDEGQYGYFYVDFKYNLEAFSFGMFTDSISVYTGKSFLPITAVETISQSVYKVYCDISTGVNGVTVVNRKTTLLTTTVGGYLPAFSTSFYVQGMPTSILKSYRYERSKFSAYRCPAVTDAIQFSMTEYPVSGCVEQAQFTSAQTTTTPVQTVTVSYWSV